MAMGQQSTARAFSTRQEFSTRTAVGPCRAACRALTVSATSIPSASSSALPGLDLIGAPSSEPARRRRALVECQAQGGNGNSQKLVIAITGATGLVGSRLASKLAAQGHKVRVLTRNVNSARTTLPYPGLEFFNQAQWAQAIKGCTGVVNLAGEPIATRWSASHKIAIKASRVNATKAVVDAIANAPPEQRPSVLVSASAVGFYGNSQAGTFSEDSPPGQDYLSEICSDWEAAAMECQNKAGVRTVIVRLGIVLAADGGALGKMLPMFNLFAGGPIGSGKQWMSWVHRDDVVDLMIEALRNQSYSGVYNATAPKPVRMSDLCSSLGNIMGRPSWLPVPDFALQTLLGEGATVVLEGQRVLPTRTQAAGFNFKFQEVNEALKNILRK